MPGATMAILSHPWDTSILYLQWSKNSIRTSRYFSLSDVSFPLLTTCYHYCMLYLLAFHLTLLISPILGNPAILQISRYSFMLSASLYYAFGKAGCSHCSHYPIKWWLPVWLIFRPLLFYSRSEKNLYHDVRDKVYLFCTKKSEKTDMQDRHACSGCCKSLFILFS